MVTFKVLPRIETKHIDACADIDLQVFKQPPSDVAIKNVECNPWAYTLITLDDKVEGYGLVLPIDSFGREALVYGDIDEDELMLKHVVLPTECGAFYIASIATRPTTRGIFRSRLVGYTLGSVLRASRPVLAVAITFNGEQISREIGLEQREYFGKFNGLDGYVPKLFFKEPFTF